MLSCFAKERNNAIAISVVALNEYEGWFKEQSPFTQLWLTSSNFKSEKGAIRLIPDKEGKLSRVLICVSDTKQFYEVAGLPMSLPEGLYYFDLGPAEAQLSEDYTLAWGLGSYQFTRYKQALRLPAKLYVKDMTACQSILAAIYEVRDLINTPTDDMGPTELAQAFKHLAKDFGAQTKETVGDALLQENYAAIHTVGRASDDAPRLLDMRWGNSKHPKITLVGKGVCFDTGGLDLKPANAMLLMKKDMGGAAHVMGLARMIMAAKLPVCLRVLIPAVENAVAGNAYRPGDIIKSKSGKTIEIGNTDAEGRVILADALTEAVSEQPALLIDISTLTGAARVALGPDLPVLFCNQDQLANEILASGQVVSDEMWRLPLYAPYREYLNSAIADINNNSLEPFAGAITAALFLQEFVPATIPWLHLDLMAWNTRPRGGKPMGGEAMAIRALFHYLTKIYS